MFVCCQKLLSLKGKKARSCWQTIKAIVRKGSEIEFQHFVCFVVYLQFLKMHLCDKLRNGSRSEILILPLKTAFLVQVQI